MKLGRLEYRKEDLLDAHTEFRKSVIDIFNEKLRLAEEARYSAPMMRQEILSLAGYLNKTINTIGQKALEIINGSMQEKKPGN